MKLSVIVPTLNEAAGIEALLQALQPERQRGHEIVVVDGGSTDGTPQLAAPLRLKHLGKPACLRRQVCTSGRRWESEGLWRTILLMWRLRFQYWCGTPPSILARRYRYGVK